MKKILLLTLACVCVNISAQDRGLSQVAAENLGSSANIGKQYALFIAIDAYNAWTPLRKPVSDAREIRDILKKDYYIDEVIELYNKQATRANIAKTFSDLQKKLGIHDSLFIYYAGHGHYDKSSDAGFWIPVDGGTDEFSQENWLPNSQIRGYISQLNTIHVFLVSDACFSGDILNTKRSMPPNIDNAYYRKAYGLTSRQVLTSGSSETVPDKSEFSAAFINCLRKNTQPLIDPLSIYNDVRLSVKQTLPLFGELNQAKHQDGASFLFFRRQTTAAAPMEPAPVQPASPISPPQGSVSVGSISISSEIAGEIYIDGTATGVRVKAGGTATINNVATETTEVAVMDDKGKIIKMPQTVMVRQGMSVAAVIERPVPEGFVRIYGGTFTMGSPANEPGRSKDETQHQVTVSSFCMAKYEVTQKEYQEVMGTNPSAFKGDNLPIEIVSWFDAIEYCNKRSQKEGLTQAYTISGSGDNRTVIWDRNASGYRLPTEAEWEYACRAGTTTPFGTGKNITTNQANYNGNYPYNNNSKGDSREKTTNVGSFAANSWGLYDMHGNVCEWCWDWYENYSESAQTDPMGASSGSRRVTRGGYYANGALFLRSAKRQYSPPDGHYIGNGFRICFP